MSEKRQNYCQLLGLNPLKESTYTREAILKKIETHKNKWANDSRNKQNDPEQRFKMQRLVESVDDIQHVMADDVLRKEEFRKAKVLLRARAQKLRQDCIILTDGSYLILPNTVDNYVKKLHWEGISSKDVLQMADIREGQPPKAVDKQTENAFKALRSVDTYTPVELLNKIISLPCLELDIPLMKDGCPHPQLVDAFEVCDRRVNNVRQDILPDQDSYIQALRTVKIVLEPEMVRVLTEYGRCQKGLEEVMETIEREYTGQQLSRHYIDDLVAAHLRGDYNRDMAISILQFYCYRRKIPANFSVTDSHMIRCPECGEMVQADKNTVYCPSCGKALRTVCPECGTSQSSTNQICIKCGFDFKEGSKMAENLDMAFKLDLKNGLVGKAEADLIKLKSIYSSYPGIASMESQLTKSQSGIKTMRKLAMDAYSRRLFYSCKKTCEDFISKYPEGMRDDPELKQRYDESVEHFNAAELLCQKALISDTHDRRMNCYVAAVDNCSDHPTARAKLREYPPQGPTDPVGKLIDGRFTIKFVPPEDNAGLTYCVYREKNSLPNVIEDTPPLAEFPSSFYTDRTMEPGVEYYYSVHSKKWGILSREGVHFGPVIVLAEVDTVNIEHIDGGLRIMYEKPRGCTRVRVWRSEENGTSGASTELPLNGETVYDDIGLTGGKQYYYLFVTEYETRNRVERSPGVVYSDTPVDVPRPVRDMKISWNRNDGTYTAKWSTQEDVVLYSCDKRLNLSGNLVKMDDINAWMKQIKPIQTYNDGVRFELPDGVVQYVYPIIPRGKMGVKGNDQMVANLKPFRDVEKTISNRDCIITMMWPAEAVEAKLVVSEDEAKGLEDQNAEIRTVRREEYQQDRMIRIPMGNSKKKCINIFAVYKLENQMVPSRGIVLDIYSEECKKVRYEMKSDRSGLHITLSSEPGVTEIYPLVAVKTSEGIPLKKTDGEVIWRSEGNVPIDAKIDIPLKKTDEPRRIRLFFENDEYYNLYKFIHPLFGRRD